MVLIGGRPRGRFRVGWTESKGAGAWLRSIGDVVTLFVMDGSSSDDDRAFLNRDGAWAWEGMGVGALGVAGKRGNIGGGNAYEVTELLKAAPATASVLPSPTSCRNFMAS
jgi:hypothetical protein